MNTYVLNPPYGKKGELIEKIRNTRNRTLNLKGATAQQDNGKATVLNLKSGNTDLGTFRTRTRKQAENVASERGFQLTIGWTDQKNELIEVCSSD